MSAPQVFQSTDINAPAGTSNVAGTLTTVLDAVLVNGYATVNVTSINRSGSVATVVCTVHGLVTGDTVRIAGATQTEYNVDAIVTKVDANTFTYPVSGTPATPATTGGTITSRKAPAGGGWTIAYTATNKRVYRAPAGNRFYVRIDDSAASSNYPRIRGYETMSDVDTGTGLFPSEAQISGGDYLVKANGAAARGWKVFADSRAFWIWMDYDGLVNGHLAGFGDFISYKGGDAYNTFIHAGNTASIGGTSMGWLQALGNSNTGQCVCRPHTQAGGSIYVNGLGTLQLAVTTPSTTQWVGTIGSAGTTYPEPLSGGLIMERMQFVEYSTRAIRGCWPGLWFSYPARPFSHGDIFNGTGALAGRTFMQINHYNGTSCMVELTDWWV